MKFRILITKTLDVPKNVYSAMYDNEEQATKAAQAKLAELNGDVAVIMEIRAGVTRVVQRFEAVRKTV